MNAYDLQLYLQLEARVDALTAGAVPLSSAIPQPLGVAAAGAGVAASRDDHVHAHGNLAGGALHADASGAAAGFMTVAQVTKLAGIATGATAEVDASGIVAGRVNLSAQTLGTGRKALEAVTVGTAAPSSTRQLTVSHSGTNDFGLVSLQNHNAQAYSNIGFVDNGGTTRLSIGQGNPSVTETSHRKPHLHLPAGDNFAILASTNTVVGGFDGANIYVYVGPSPGYASASSATTTSGGGKLHIVNTDIANFNAAMIDSYSGAAGTAASNTIAFRGARNTLAAPAAVATNDILGGWTANGWHSSGAYAASGKAAVFARAGSGWTITSQETYLSFQTTASGGTSRTEKMSILGDGTVNVVTANGLTVNAVVVPTISSSHTLTNKTLTSPTINAATLTGTISGGTFTGSTLTTPAINGATLSGTLSGGATLSGNLTLSGANSFTGASNTFSNPIVHSNATGITGFAGGGQASATALTKAVNFVTTVASANDSVKLPVAVAGLPIVVFNAGANACDVYPVTGSAIDALGTNNPYSLAAGASREFFAQTTTQWLSR